MTDIETSARDEAAIRSRRRIWLITGVAGGAAVVALICALLFIPRTVSPGASTDAAPDDVAVVTPTTEPAAPAVRPEGDTVTPPPATGVPDDAYPELEPVPVDSIVDTQGLRVALTRFESVQGEVQGPGEVAGAAVRVTLSLTNEGDGDLDLDLVVLNAFMGNQRDPAETYEQPGGSPVTGTLAPGETAEGVYLFRIPEDRRGDVTFIVDYRQSESAVVFRGAIS